MDKYKKFRGQEYFFTDDSHNLYFKSFHTGRFELIKYVDLESIDFLSGTYFYDKERIFHGSKCLKKGYSTFKDYESYGYFKIDNVLLWNGKKVKEDFTADLVNISEHFFTDNELLFVNGRIFDFDKDTFRILSKFYAKDSNIVFYSDSVIDSADAETFRVIPEDSGYSAEFLGKFDFLKDGGYSGWACDRKNLYHCGMPFLSGVIDPLTTRIIRHHILMDKNNVYFYKKIVKDADPDTFECIVDASKIDDRLNYIKIFTPFFKDKDNIFYFYEDEARESKDEIIKCTKRNRTKFIDDMRKLSAHLDVLNLVAVDVERIKRLLED